MAAGALACGGDGGDAGASAPDGVSVRDSAGVRIVENGSPAWAGDEGWSIGAAPELRLGTATGGGPEQFGSVADVALLSDGRVAVADGDAQEIRIFSPAGEHLVTAGGEGDGPGEFSQLSTLAAGPGDTLAAGDISAGTVSIFAPDGSFVREVRPETGGGSMFRRLRGVLDDGTVVVSHGVDPRSMTTGPSGVHRDTSPEYRVGRDGAVLDTLGRFAGREQTGAPSGSRSVFFGRGTHFAVAGDRLYAGDDARWEIHAVDPSGRLVGIVRRPHDPVAVRPEDLEARRDERISSMKESFAGMGVPSEMQEKLLSSVREAPARETLPAFDDLLVSRDGHVWVEEARRPGETPPRWSVLDPDGRWLGVVESPAGLEVKTVGPGRLAGVRGDELGVQRVETYAIRKP